MHAVPTGSRRLTPTEWLIVSMAAIGFAFDIYELLMMPLIIKDLIMDLTGFKPGSDGFLWWGSMLFYLPAVAGGVFGLLGGYLTDRLGRRRVLTWSILIYAFSAFAAGFSTTIEMLLILRCTTFVGVCVEFVAAVAWLAELFTDPRQRENVLGYTQAFSSLGGLLVAGVYGLIVQYKDQLPGIVLPESLSFLGGQISDGHAPWRYTLMSGLVPALPLLLIRPFLPESPIWARKRAEGTLHRPSIGELFSPALRRTTIITTLMFACSYGAAFGAIQQIPQIIPGVPDVQAETAGMAMPQQKKIEQENAAWIGKIQEIGGLVGRFALAILAVRIVSRRALLRVFQWPGLIVVPLIFVWTPAVSLNAFTMGAFLAGFLVVAQFSFWGNYLPRVYPLHLRGTGEGFAANIGGRMIGTSFAAVTTLASKYAPGDLPADRLTNTAAVVALCVFLVGSILSFWLPEPTQEELPE